MIKAIIYDFDGTLANTLHLHYQAYKKSLSKLGINLKREEIIKTCFNVKDKDIAKKFKINQKLFSNYYREQVQKDLTKNKLYANVLKTFKKIKIPIAIGTYRNRDELEPIIKKIKLDKYCKITVTRDEAQGTKKDIFMKICKKLNVKPEETLIVGDSESDLMNANKIKAISALFYPNNNKKYYDLKKLKKHKPKFIIKKHEEIIKIINTQ